MTKANVNELEKQIAEKNFLLDSLKHDGNPDKEKITVVKTELDNLLYTYFKSMKCSCKEPLILWADSL